MNILTSIKKLLGVSETDTNFDVDIIIYINSAFATLNQIGVGPEDTFYITDTSVWSDFTTRTDLEQVKTFVYLNVKKIFDPPPTSFGIEALERQISEYEWRLRTKAEVEAIPIV